MASPLPHQVGGHWNSGSQPMPAAPEPEDPSIQIRPMSLKVHYTFDKEAQINCLARFPQTLNVQTIALDEKNAIGIVDLRLCIQAVTQCSPELAGLYHDYTIYARDFSEPDTPLVGQGMLSWALESIRADVGGQPPNMVTGRVTKNLLGVFGGGNKETLEVRLKLTEAAKVQRAQDAAQHVDTQNTQAHLQHQAPQQPQQPQPFQSRPESALTPTGAAEWNSFIQSNPHIGQPAAYSRGLSPALAQGPPPPAMMADRQEPPQAPHQPMYHQQQRPPPPLQPHHYHQPQPQQVEHQQQVQQQQGVQRVAPTPVDTTGPIAVPVPASRPSSRASNSSQGRRKKPPTGRPRGRPRKKPADGSTSGYEDGTEGEDGGPAKKRAKPTKVDKANTNPFGSGPDSLRVAASTSGAIRSFRPINLHEGTAGSHLDEAPRAPTPVPQGPMMGIPGRGNKIGLRKESSMQHELSADQPPVQSERQRPLSPSQEDGRSPESIAPTPAYSDDSHMDIGSSPPVPRTTSFMRSSPPPSSPVLPPMPLPEVSRAVPTIDSDMNNVFEDDSSRPNPAVKAPTTAQPRPVQWRRTSSAVPMQVFRMEDGPDGQDMVHICNYNAPESALSAMPTSDAAPVMKNPLQPRPVSRRARAPQVPTPPPTTDSVEQIGSPAKVPTLAVEASVTNASPDTQPSASTEPTTAPELASCQLGQSAVDSQSEPGRQWTSAAHDENSKVASTVAQPAPTINSPAQPPVTLPQPVAPPPKKAKSRSRARKLPQPQSENTSPVLPPLPARSLSQPAVPQSQGPLSAPPTTLRRSASVTGLELPTPASESIPLELPATIEEPRVVESPMAVNALGLELPRPSSRLGPLELPAPIINSLAPVGLKATTAGPAGVCPPSADCLPVPSSPTGTRSNKNIVKKFAIKQRLEDAIAKGELPQYCSNCGAIETPTWRKVWMDERMGEPAPVELSSQPGRVTAVDILKYDPETEKPSAYRLTKKSLAEGEIDEERGGTWRKVLLCNPCGIWLGKSLSHRPSDRWEKDADRLGQRRTKRVPGQPTKSRSRKRTKSDSQQGSFPAAVRPLSSGGPVATSLIHGPETMTRAATEPATVSDGSLTRDTVTTNNNGNSNGNSNGNGNGNGAGAGTAPTEMGSTHSRGSGTAKSPIALEVDDAMGSTKRLLFPSPNKAPKMLGELDINIVHISNDCRQPKGLDAEKENIAVNSEEPGNEADDLEALFRSPMPPRPSTPTAKASGTPGSGFKTPTRPTPSQRPITRSISRSIRSWKVQKTPRGASNPPQTPTPSSRRRSPRNHDTTFGENIWNNTPVSRAISQMLSDNPHLSDPIFAIAEAEGFSDGLDFSDLPQLDGSDSMQQLSSWLSTDGVMPATSPKNDNYFDYDGSTDALEAWHLNLLKDQAKAEEA